MYILCREWLIQCMYPVLSSGRSQDHRTTGYFMSEGTWRGLWSNLPLKAGAAVRSDQVAQDFIQLGLENLQGRRLDSLSGQPIPLFECPHGERICPYILSETLAFYFVPIASRPPSRLRAAWLPLCALSLGPAVRSPPSCLSSSCEPPSLSLSSWGR